MRSKVFVFNPKQFYYGLKFFAATFDVQKATAKGGFEITMIVQFITNTRAIGCFVVLESDDESHVFRILLRNGSNIMTGLIGLPPSTYAVYVYDLEEDGYINREPAIRLLEDRIHVNVTTNCKLHVLP